MDKAKVDPKGLQTFFTRLLKQKTGDATAGKSDNSSTLKKQLEPLTDLFSTHPGTDDRIARLKPRAGGTEPAILNNAEWQALKAICN